MAVSLKPIKEQVIVITGASSGIGLSTARLAARKGARLVLVSRNEEALAQLEQEINSSGGQAIHVAADVADRGQIQRVAEAAIGRFGSFDTWINDAAVSIYGRLEEIQIDDARRLFETNFWGMVHGSMVAVEHLKQRGGSLINVGSTVSDRAIPLQGYYVASKHAVKGFTDSLRMELEKDGAPISVTLIKPGSIDTPFTENAKSYMEQEPDVPPPVYAPEVVARAILYAAAHPQREIYVGGGGKMISTMEKYAPRLADKYMQATLFRQQKKDRPASRHDALYSHGRGLQERGGHQGHVMKSSLYTQASLHPWTTALMLGAAGVAIAGLITGRKDSWD